MRCVPTSVLLSMASAGADDLIAESGSRPPIVTPGGAGRDGSKAPNWMGMLIKGGDVPEVKHHPIHFSASPGSAGFMVNRPNHRNVCWLDRESHATFADLLPWVGDSWGTSSRGGNLADRASAVRSPYERRDRIVHACLSGTDGMEAVYIGSALAAPPRSWESVLGLERHVTAARRK